MLNNPNIYYNSYKDNVLFCAREARPLNIFYLRKPYKRTIIKFRKNKSAISFAQ